MTVSQRDRQLLREAEGYLELVVSSMGELPLPMRQQMVERAMAALDQVSADRQDRPVTLMLRGHALQTAEKYDEAIVVLRRAVEVDEENIHVFLALGWCYKRVDRLDLAIQTLEEALVLDPDEPILHYNLACYWALAKDVEMTVQYLAHAFDLDPELREQIAGEPDFDAVRDMPAFSAITSMGADIR